MLAKLRGRLTFANVVSMMALFVALSGGAYALTIPRNSVGPKQLKKKAVNSRKVKNNSLTGADVRNNRLTGRDLRESSLARVPAANAANTATSAGTATNVAASEAFREVGTAGQPPFENGCGNQSSGVPAQEYERVGFYKDKLGVVHLKGVLQCPAMAVGSSAFRLPAGYRPANNRVVAQIIFCGGCGASNSAALNILGAGTNPGGVTDGGVLAAGTLNALDGVTFRAGG
jgi:hypothetical protein